jgi:hypothetical protein
MIDLMKIGNIKNKAGLKKYRLNKPLMNGNYLFHYLILTDNLKGLKLYNHPIYKFNNDGLNGLMLAAREKKYNILNYLVEKYKKDIKLVNKKGLNFLHYMNPNDNEYLEFIININYNLIDLYQAYSTTHITPLDLLFLQGKYNTINSIINKIDFNYKSYLSQPYHFNLLLNTNLKNNTMEKLLDTLIEKDEKILKYVDDMGYDISFPIVINKNMDLLKYIINKRGDELDKYSPISTSHIFVLAYKDGLKSNNFEMAKYILDNVMIKHNYDETDMYGNNMAHFILKMKLHHNGNYDIEKQILSKYKSWGRLNMDKKTPFDYIINLNFDKYHKFVINKPKNYSEIKDKKWVKYISNLPIDNENDMNIKMINSPYAHSNMFQARFTDIGVFSIYLSQKYKSTNNKLDGTSKGKSNELYMPIYNGDDVTPNWNDDMLLPDNMLNFNNNFPWIIIWNDDKNYWIHPHLTNLINKNKKENSSHELHYKAAFSFISMRLPDGGLHAALLFFDFTRNQIQRFDPYGDTTVLDGQMDEIFKEKIAKPCKMSYCGPDCYFPVSGFQTLSDETNSMNQKMGDFGGYCLAWSIWYVEHKMINLNVEPKDLIRKTINRFIKMNVRPMEYIRNYANYISLFRIGYLKKIGVPENIASNEHLNNMYTNIINKSIIEYK